MKGLWRQLVLALMVAGSATSTVAAGNPSLLSDVEGAVLRGDIEEGLALLRNADPAQLDRFSAQQRACLLSRFDRPSPAYLEVAGAPVVRDIAWAYQRYWWHALREPARRAVYEERLKADLARILDHPSSASFDEIEARVQAVLLAEGWHSQLGRTPPLRDLMLWRKERVRDYDVELPEGAIRVRAHLLDAFGLLGWSSYGRCERGSSGGWATDTAIFAIVPAYKEGLDSEEFRVVFLAHEAQHFSDKVRYPPMADWEYEYRAKLVELSMGNAVSAKRLAKFITTQGDDPGAPHPYASRRVVDGLRAALGPGFADAPIMSVRRAALDLLAKDSAKRLAR